MHRLYLVAIFLSAFLLFLVQPLISKAILPWFGGAPAVWTTCMLFFQILLFIGYVYAHLVSTYAKPKALAIIHTCVIVTAILMLPVLPDPVWKPTAGVAPTWRILALLTVCVGLPFFLLSSSAPLIQVWWQRTKGGEPYRLYALSNAGSLLALMMFPLFFEPLMWTSTQGTVWSVAFVLLGAMLVAGAWHASRATPPAPAKTSEIGKPEARPKKPKKSGKSKPQKVETPWQPTWPVRAAWLLLPATAVVLLLATTSHVCQDMAVVPFLWIVPLVIYLVTFIICFGKSTGYRRGWCAGLLIISTYGCAVLYRAHNPPDFTIALVINLAALFACCMLCHGELVRLKPPAEHLTSFYLLVSAGGALGGLFVSLVAPAAFTDYFEYPLGWVVCWLIMFAVLFRSATSKLQKGRPLWAWVLLIACFFVCVGLFSEGVVHRSQLALLRMRNFYGVLAVTERADSEKNAPYISLQHGVIEHGRQYLEEHRRYEPTTYYTRDSGVGYAIDAMRGDDSLRIGAVGMGVGTIAAYAQEGDYIRFYEINPHVITLAQEVFQYLNFGAEQGAEIEIIEGDARLSLEEEPDQEFDVIVLDAFSSDAIPVHLLTVEAFSEYLRHLKDDGIVAMHISNRYLDLVPLAAALAREHNLDWTSVVEMKPNGRKASTWILLARRGGLAPIENRENVVEIADAEVIDAWTDKFSNLLRLLRWNLFGGK